MPMEMPKLDELFRKVLGLRVNLDVESNAFIQYFVDKGRTEESAKILLRLGRIRFGPPPGQGKATLAGITNLNRLEELGDRLFEVSSWDELLAAP